MTFNQVVRGSSPRCLMNRHQSQTDAFFLFCHIKKNVHQTAMDILWNLCENKIIRFAGVDLILKFYLSQMSSVSDIYRMYSYGIYKKFTCNSKLTLL